MRMHNSLPARAFRWLLFGPLLIVSLTSHTSAQDIPDQSGTENIASSMKGQWRGVMEIQDGVYLSLGLNISDEGMTLDSPNQSMFARPPTEFSISNEQVSLIDQELGARYEAQLNDGVLVGTFHQARALPLRMHRLNEHDQQRLAFEGTYQGDLEVNAQTSLPLRINIAVLHSEDPHGAYLATMDSPAQQSFGLPVESVSVSAEQLSFESSMIRATYQGHGRDGTYQGTFIQGVPYPLTLEKVADDAPLAEFAKPEPGTQGGAMAILVRNADAEISSEQQFFRAHNEHSQYEIGSVTKTMVAFLLAKLAEDGVVDESDAAAKWIEEADDSITLQSLATHHSGLPRLPANLFDDADAQDPYAHFSEQHLRSALRTTRLNEKGYAYSNYGFGLLGETLAKANGQSFAALLDSALFVPAGMHNSYVALSDTAAGENFSQGFDSLGQEAGAWHFEALAGAGAVVSSLADMQAYLQFMMDLMSKDSALAERLLEARYPLTDCCEQALGWILQEYPEGRMTAWHGGQTGGYSAFIGFYLDGSAGLVWLNAQSVDHSGEMLKKLWSLPRE